MRKIIAGFNANTVVIMAVSGLLCWMQTRVLNAVYVLPAIEQQLMIFKDEMGQLREQLKREEQERKDADRENKERIRMMEDRAARQP